MKRFGKNVMVTLRYSEKLLQKNHVQYLKVRGYLETGTEEMHSTNIKRSGSLPRNGTIGLIARRANPKKVTDVKSNFE